MLGRGTGEAHNVRNVRSTLCVSARRVVVVGVDGCNDNRVCGSMKGPRAHEACVRGAGDKIDEVCEREHAHNDTENHGK